MTAVRVALAAALTTAAAALLLAAGAWAFTQTLDHGVLHGLVRAWGWLPPWAAPWAGPAVLAAGAGVWAWRGRRGR